MGNTSSRRGSGLSGEKVQQLVGMGFDRNLAELALQETSGNLDSAVELLISQGGQRNSDALDRRERMARAAEERLQQAQSRGTPTKQPKASSYGGEKNKPSDSPAKTFEARVDSAVVGLMEYPEAVDTLLYVIKTILEHEGVQKYREIKMTNRRFSETIGKARTWGTSFLKILGFVESGEWYVLRGEDPAKLWIAKSKLESIQETAIYRVAKERIAFEKVLKESMSSASKEEEKRRERYASRVPVEPDLGAAGTTRITLFCGENVQQRRFNADDTLDDVIMWFGATHSSLIPSKLKENVWELVDRTLFPAKVLDVELLRGKTLQAIQLWPSAELQIQVTGTLETETKHRIGDKSET